MDWYTVDSAHMLGVMSVQAVTYYESWLKLMPQKAGRLDEITAGVVSEFRAALLSNPLNVLEPDVRKLPQPCVRYAETLVIGALYREMDKPLSEVEQSQVIRAEITLRTFYTRALQVTVQDKGSGFPSYSRLPRRPAAATPSVVVETVATPAFSPAGGGQADSSVSVVVSCATVGSVIRYTVDGSEPGTGSPAISSVGAVVVSVPGALKARAYKVGMEMSLMRTAYYTAVAAGRVYFHAAGQAITTADELSAWMAGVPAGGSLPAPAAGTSFALAVTPGTVCLVIAYPASIRELGGAIQQSTGMKVRLAWVNSPYSRVIEHEGLAYRVYQWMPAFAWENADVFDIVL